MGFMLVPSRHKNGRFTASMILGSMKLTCLFFCAQYENETQGRAPLKLVQDS